MFVDWVALLRIFFSILIIASTSIGIECLNKGDEKQKNGTNKKFLVFILVASIFAAVLDTIFSILVPNFST